MERTSFTELVGKRRAFMPQLLKDLKTQGFLHLKLGFAKYISIPGKDLESSIMFRPHRSRCRQFQTCYEISRPSTSKTSFSEFFKVFESNDSIAATCDIICWRGWDVFIFRCSGFVEGDSPLCCVSYTQIIYPPLMRPRPTSSRIQHTHWG